MKFIKVVCLLTFFSFNSLFSQSIVKIDDESITTQEFMQMFEKNNVVDTISVADYLDLFINYKLKVKEAKSLKLDKNKEFIEELNGYKAQLAAPYLIDESFKEQLIKDAYEHSKYDLRASHILINLDEDATPEDTLKAYNKILELRNRIIGGESFKEIAYKYSDDPSARERMYYGKKLPPNYGDLGYFTAFSMIYEFEQAAYQTKVGEVSMPVRSKFGYHIIKITDKVPAMGQSRASHLVFFIHGDTKADSLKAYNKAQKAYKRIINGDDFYQVAIEMSEDSSSAPGGGRMKSFLPSQIDPTFIYNLSRLEVGNYSKPFLSPYGYHIAKLEFKTGIKSFQEEKQNILDKIKQSDRVKIQNQALVDRMKIDYNFNYANQENFNILNAQIVKHIHHLDSIDIPLDKPLFTYANKTAKQADFINYIAGIRKSPKLKATQLMVYNYYQDFIEKCLKEVEYTELETKFPEFKATIKEYKEGILLYDVNNKMVWDKAAKDTTGLREFYNKRTYKYVTGDKIDATIIKVKENKNAIKIRNKIKRNNHIDEALEKMTKVKEPAITIERDLYPYKDNPIIRKAGIKEGLSKVIKHEGINYIVYVHEFLISRPRPFEECRGLVLADYQKELEVNWIKELKNKYRVVINRDELQKLVNQNNK